MAIKKLYPKQTVNCAVDSEEAKEIEQFLMEMLDQIHEFHRIVMFKIFDLTAAGVYEGTTLKEDPKHMRRLKDEIGYHCRETLLKLFKEMGKVKLIVGDFNDEYGVTINPEIMVTDDATCLHIDFNFSKVLGKIYLGKMGSLTKNLTLFGEYAFGGVSEPIKMEKDGIIEIENVLSHRALYFAQREQAIIEEQIREFLVKLEANNIVKDDKLNDLIRLPK